MLAFETGVIARLCDALQDHKGLTPFARIVVQPDVIVELSHGFLTVIEKQTDNIEHRTCVSWSDLPLVQRQALESAAGYWLVGMDVLPVPLRKGKFGIGEA